MELHCDTFQIKYLHHNDIAYQVRIWLFMVIKSTWCKQKGGNAYSLAFFQSKLYLFHTHHTCHSRKIHSHNKLKFPNIWTMRIIFEWLKILVYAYRLTRIFRTKFFHVNFTNKQCIYIMYIRITCVWLSKRTQSIATQQTHHCLNSVAFPECFKSCHIFNIRQAAIFSLCLICNCEIFS